MHRLTDDNGTASSKPARTPSTAPPTDAEQRRRNRIRDFWRRARESKRLRDEALTEMLRLAADPATAADIKVEAYRLAISAQRLTKKKDVW